MTGVMNTLRSFVVGALLATPALAQALLDPASSAWPPLRFPPRQIVPTEGAAAEVWAARDGYKVGFHGGMTFVPYLGQDYPHNQPFAWRTLSVRVGAEERHDAVVRPELVIADERVEYRFPTFTEAYDLRDEGLEQTFVIPAPPRVAGDLVVRGAVGTQLQAQHCAARHGGLVFHDDAGQPIVGYGAAFAVDGNGVVLPMTTAFDGEVVELRLPAADVARARFPLTVDPLLTPILLSVVGGAWTDLDACAASSVLDSVLATATRYASANDGDIVSRLYYGLFTAASDVFADLSTSTNCDHARAGAVAATDRFVLAYRSLDAAGTSRVRVHVRDTVEILATTNSVGLLNVSGTHDWRPVVGGTAYGSPGVHALVVLQREVLPTAAPFANGATSTVVSRLFSTSTLPGSWGTAAAVSTSTISDAERPSVTRVGDGEPGGGWVVVFQQIGPSGNDDWDLSGRRVSHDGTLAGGQWLSDFALGSLHQFGARVAGRGGRYAVLYATTDVASAPPGDPMLVGKQLYLERFDWLPGQNPDSAAFVPVPLQTGTVRWWEPSDLAFDEHTTAHWCPVYRQTTVGAPTAYYARAGFTGNLLENAYLHLQAGHVPGRIGVSYSPSLRYFTAALGIDTGGGTSSTRLHRITQPLPTPAGNAGQSCSPAALTWAGPSWSPQHNQLIGSDRTGPRVTGAPANALHLVAVSLASDDFPILDAAVASNCRVLVSPFAPSFLGFLPLEVGDAATWRLPLPESLSSMTIHLQDWLLDPAAGVFFSTRRLTVPLAR
jgi:hypothetical protein